MTEGNVDLSLTYLICFIAPSISPQVIPALDSEPENDSGLEDSYPPVPQVTAVIIPDGRWNDTNEKDGKEIPQCDTNEVMKNASSNELTKIMFELNQKVGQLYFVAI